MKALKKSGLEGTYFNIIKVIHDKPITTIILNKEKLEESISSKIKKRLGYPRSPFFWKLAEQ